MKKYIPIILIATMMSTPVLAVPEYDLAKNKMLKYLRQGEINEALSFAKELTKSPGARRRELGNEYLTVINSVRTAVPPTPPPMPETLTREVATLELTEPQWLTMGVEKGWLKTAGGEVPAEEQIVDKAFEDFFEKLKNYVPSSKLPMVQGAIRSVYDNGSIQQKTMIKNLPPYAIKALATATDQEMSEGLLREWFTLSDTARQSFLTDIKDEQKRVTELEKLLKTFYQSKKAGPATSPLLERILAKKATAEPSGTAPLRPRPSKDTRPLNEQARTWDEAKFNHEIGKRRVELGFTGILAPKADRKAKVEDEIKTLDKLFYLKFGTTTEQQ